MEKMMLNACEWDTISNNLFFNSVEDAVKVLQTLRDFARTYGFVTVADLILISGNKENLKFGYNDYGWDLHDLLDVIIDRKIWYRRDLNKACKLQLPKPKKYLANRFYFRDWQKGANPCTDGYSDDLLDAFAEALDARSEGWKNGFEAGKEFAMKQVQALIDSLKGADEK